MLAPHAAPREAPREWEDALRRVLAAPEDVRLAFQPVVDLVRGVAVGYEALARFPPPPRGSPARWFAAALGQGVAAPLQAHTVRAALAARATLPANCFLSVNVEPNVLHSDEVQAAFADGGRLDGVVIELTEHAKVESYGRLYGGIDACRSAGAAIAIDDAGARYAGLTHLLRVRPDFVKVDSTLVAGNDRDDVKRAFVEGRGNAREPAGRVGRRRGDRARRGPRSLIGLRVPLGQGYVLGRPRAHYGNVDEALAAHLRASAAAQDPGDIVSGLVEPAPSAVAGEQAKELLLSSGGADVAALLDEAGRPRGLLRREDVVRGEAVATRPQRIKRVSRVRDVLAKGDGADGREPLRSARLP